MKITPRDYQAAAVDSVFDYFTKKKGNPLIAMPTGTGKSIVIAQFCERVIRQYPGQTIFILTHVKELVSQNYEKMLYLWPDAPIGINSAGLGRRDVYCDILFAGIASIVRGVHKMPAPSLIMIDEAHLVSPSESTMYRKVIAHFLERNKHLKVIGLTATPWRLGQGMLTDEGGIFTDICFDLTNLRSFNWLIHEGYLCPLIPKPMKTMLDTDGVHTVGGDFNSSELQLAVNKDEITEAALRETRELAHDRDHWLIFSSGLLHAKRISEMLDALNISNVVVNSKMPSKERDENILKFKRGQVRAAVNYGVLTTGFDYPEIDCIVMLRPTQSPVLWVQMLGRGTRPVYQTGFDLSTTEGRLQAIEAGPKHNCLVLDFARNTTTLGPINDPQIPRKKGKGGGEPPIKLCEACNTYNHISVRFCVCCGSEFHFAIKIQAQAETQEVMKIEEFPVVETFKVQSVNYQPYEKKGSPPMVRVTYYCFVHSFTEHLCFEHEGGPRKRAERWWRERAIGPVPETVDEALRTIGLAKEPTHLAVVVNRRYPAISGFCFDGTAFGTGPASDSRPTSTVIEEDDIPF